MLLSMVIYAVVPWVSIVVAIPINRNAGTTSRIDDSPSLGDLLAAGTLQLPGVSHATLEKCQRVLAVLKVKRRSTTTSATGEVNDNDNDQDDNDNDYDGDGDGEGNDGGDNDEQLGDVRGDLRVEISESLFLSDQPQLHGDRFAACVVGLFSHRRLVVVAVAVVAVVRGDDHHVAGHHADIEPTADSDTNTDTDIDKTVVLRLVLDTSGTLHENLLVPTVIRRKLRVFTSIQRVALIWKRNPRLLRQLEDAVRSLKQRSIGTPPLPPPRGHGGSRGKGDRRGVEKLAWPSSSSSSSSLTAGAAEAAAALAVAAAALAVAAATSSSSSWSPGASSDTSTSTSSSSPLLSSLVQEVDVFLLVRAVELGDVELVRSLLERMPRAHTDPAATLLLDVSWANEPTTTTTAMAMATTTTATSTPMTMSEWLLRYFLDRLLGPMRSQSCPIWSRCFGLSIANRYLDQWLDKPLIRQWTQLVLGYLAVDIREHLVAEAMLSTENHPLKLQLLLALFDPQPWSPSPWPSIATPAAATTTLTSMDAELFDFGRVLRRLQQLSRDHDVVLLEPVLAVVAQHYHLRGGGDDGGSGAPPSQG